VNAGVAVDRQVRQMYSHERAHNLPQFTPGRDNNVYALPALLVTVGKHYLLQYACLEPITFSLSKQISALCIG